MIPWHVGLGMNGAVLVLPRAGLNDGAGKPLKYDRVTMSASRISMCRRRQRRVQTYDSAADSYVDAMEVMHKLIPTHVVFNGAVGALTARTR